MEAAIKHTSAERKMSGMLRQASMPKRSPSASSLDWMGQQRRVEEPVSPVRVAPISRQVRVFYLPNSTRNCGWKAILTGRCKLSRSFPAQGLAD